MSEPQVSIEKFNPTQALRNLNPGDKPIITDIRHYKVIESTRIREKNASGARFNITRNEAAGIITITCIERPVFYSDHGITIQAKYIGKNTDIVDADEVHILRIYTGNERIHLHKQDGSINLVYTSFTDFTNDWEVIK